MTGTETPGPQTPGPQTPGTQAPGPQTPGPQTPGTQTPGTVPADVPVVRVLRGHPTEEEVAALVLVLTTLPSGPPAPPADRPTGWSNRARALHATPTPGPGAWVASARPG